MVLSVTRNAPDHRPILAQAPVRALDPDGIAVVSSGTAAFAVGAVVCWIFRDSLAASGRDWYFLVAVAGTLIGGLGLVISVVRGRRRRTGAPRRSVEDAGVDADGVPDRG